MISVSIVSHGHGALVATLLQDLVRVARDSPLEVILTNNVPEGRIAGLPAGLDGQVIDNPAPLGFGHNHNQALALARGTHVCVMNPDIRLLDNPFPALERESDRAEVGLVAPAILSAAHRVEDNARRFPTPWSLLRRRTGGNDGRYHYAQGDAAMAVDWVAGMFMLARTEAFRAIGGFDQRYFLYCEDVDLCARMWRAGRSVMLCPQVAAIHDARRDSHRHLKFLRWHAASYLRYFATHWLRPVRTT